jgi:hypothetical protein
MYSVFLLHNKFYIAVLNRKTSAKSTNLNPIENVWPFRTFRIVTHWGSESVENLKNASTLFKNLRNLAPSRPSDTE